MQNLACSTIRVGDYTRKCGFSKVVIGLSGGGFVVWLRSTAALGPENVLGVLMLLYSSDHSIQDALIMRI